MNALSRTGTTLLATAAVLLASSTIDARTRKAESLDGVQTVEAVWKVQSLNFAYHGDATIYSCDALRSKVHDILQRVGAHETLQVRTVGCSEMLGSGSMEITLASPVEATPENVEALSRHDARQVLIARVRNERLADAEDLQRFAATWRTVSMSRDRVLKLGPSDCELVEQLSRDVFPRMSIRVQYENLHCSTAFGNIGQPQLRIAALVAVQVPGRGFGGF